MSFLRKIFGLGKKEESSVQQERTNVEALIIGNIALAKNVVKEAVQLYNNNFQNQTQFTDKRNFRDTTKISSLNSILQNIINDIEVLENQKEKICNIIKNNSMSLQSQEDRNYLGQKYQELFKLFNENVTSKIKFLQDVKSQIVTPLINIQASSVELKKNQLETSFNILNTRLVFELSVLEQFLNKKPLLEFENLNKEILNRTKPQTA